MPTSWDDVVRSMVLESSVWGPHSLHTAEATRCDVATRLAAQRSNYGFLAPVLTLSSLGSFKLSS
jgi:hypothetical protein